ncbi:hypothetical protein BV25DRAFT_1995478 [Artomyces pyxidatus]|uniref:Uncharacterized protein n=1 Tax=Artomyces pyxidatus TaxID=48021 RepID=A0ACB8SJE4_9AGAM|nr:hypothetical protein BV25DRAFT_1995478 [Artomyces pyxidatus]
MPPALQPFAMFAPRLTRSLKEYSPYFVIHACTDFALGAALAASIKADDTHRLADLQACETPNSAEPVVVPPGEQPLLPQPSPAWQSTSPLSQAPLPAGTIDSPDAPSGKGKRHHKYLRQAEKRAAA